MSAGAVGLGHVHAVRPRSRGRRRDRQPASILVEQRWNAEPDNRVWAAVITQRGVPLCGTHALSMSVDEAHSSNTSRVRFSLAHGTCAMKGSSPMIEDVRVGRPCGCHPQVELS